MGATPIWQVSSTMRRLPVESSDTNLSRNAVMPMRSMSSSARAPSRRSARATVGSRSIAAAGSTTVRCRSSATHTVWCTVSAGNSRASWNDRARPSRARRCRPPGGHVGAVEHDATGVGIGEARDHVEQRGLAGAVGPDQSEDLAVVQLQRDAVERGDTGEASMHVVDPQHDRAPVPWRVVPPRARRTARVAPIADGSGTVARARRLEEDRIAAPRGGRRARAVGPRYADATLVEEERAVGGVERGAHRLFDEHDRDAFRMELLEHVQDLVDDQRCEPERQLVDQQHLRARRASPSPPRASAADRRTGRAPDRATACAARGRASSARSVASRTNTGSRRCSHAPMRRFSATVSDGNTLRPPGTWTRPRAAMRWAGSP